MVCYGCGVELFGYQSYKSMYCSQCLNRRAVEEQTRVQAEMAERQLEFQREQMEQMARERDRMDEQRQYQQPVQRVKKPRVLKPYMEMVTEMENNGPLPFWDDLVEASNVLYEQCRRAVIESRNPGIGFLQRKFGLSFTVAQQMFEKMQKNGIISEWDESIQGCRVLVG